MAFRARGAMRAGHGEGSSSYFLSCSCFVLFMPVYIWILFWLPKTSLTRNRVSLHFKTSSSSIFPNVSHLSQLLSNHLLPPTIAFYLLRIPSSNHGRFDSFEKLSASSVEHEKLHFWIVLLRPNRRWVVRGLCSRHPRFYHTNSTYRAWTRKSLFWIFYNFNQRCLVLSLTLHAKQ